MSRYQKGKTNLDFTEARDSEWQWHQLGHSDVLQYCLSISKYSKNVINLFNKYDACVGDVVNIDVTFCKFADSCRLKCVG